MTVAVKAGHRTGPGRPTIGPGVGFCCPAEVLNGLNGMARELGLPRADLIRRIFLVGWEAAYSNGELRLADLKIEARG